MMRFRCTAFESLENRLLLDAGGFPAAAPIEFPVDVDGVHGPPFETPQAHGPRFPEPPAFGRPDEIPRFENPPAHGSRFDEPPAHGRPDGLGPSQDRPMDADPSDALPVVDHPEQPEEEPLQGRMPEAKTPPKYGPRFDDPPAHGPGDTSPRFESPPAHGPRQFAGDTNGDGMFDRKDIVQVLQAGKYGTGRFATFEQGDWNGDGVFDGTDIVVALQFGPYVRHPHL